VIDSNVWQHLLRFISSCFLLHFQLQKGVKGWQHSHLEKFLASKDMTALTGLLRFL